MRHHGDIFCRVIDNFGDIGVCWRLARQLADEHRIDVRLWVDDLASLAPLQPELDIQSPRQKVSGVEIRLWSSEFMATDVADVVIEAFACDIPDCYLRAMAEQKTAPVWINLEYLTAETWAEDCHGMQSPHPALALKKTFFFPGFSERSGGLLREKSLLPAHNTPAQHREDVFSVSLFCYDNAPVGPMLDALADWHIPQRCDVFAGKAEAAVKRHFGAAGPWRRDQLEVVPITFVPQADYDALLRQHDLNFVRGEDSFVRAQWAARPFVWQIYPQEEDAHFVKLDAFLDRYCCALSPEASRATRRLFHAWNGRGEIGPAWRDFVEHLHELGRHARTWADTLSQQPDLATNLVKYCCAKV